MHGYRRARFITATEMLSMVMARLLAFMNENPAAWVLLSSGFCVLAGLCSLVFQYRVRHWPQVWGVPQGAAVEDTGATEWSRSEQDYRAKVRYVYEVNGRRFEGHRLSSMAVVASHNAQAVLHQQLEGVETRGEDQVKVYFNPKNPRKATSSTDRRPSYWSPSG